MQSDADHYQVIRLAEANLNLYTEEYLRNVLYTSLANNHKIFFGEKLPEIFMDLMPVNNNVTFP